VWLVTTNRLRIDYLGTFVTTPRVSEKATVVQVRTRLRNDTPASALCTLITTVRDRDGKAAGSVESSQEVAAGGEHESVQQVKLEQPSLWFVESPYLYTSHSEVRRDGREVDRYETPFGIREIAFDADRGFLLNGRRVKLNGVCLHHDAGAVGAAVPERVWERRLEILKEMGCNAIRTSHNPFAAEFLDLCDKMGFLVMDEIFDEWKVPKGQIDGFGYSLYFDEWHERDVVNFVRRDRNHPSVVLWSAGNEVGDQAAAGGAETLRKLNGIFHREDPTRLVTVGCDRIESEPADTNRIRPEFYNAMDVVGYNYVDRWRDRKEKFYSIDRHRFPDKKFIGTESGSMGGARGEYAGLIPGAARGGGGFFFRSGRPNIDVEQLQKFVQTYDYVAGDHMWTGIDYLGESRWPSKGAAAGVIDTCGFVKDGYYFYQSQWTKEPVLHLFPHWNWPGQEGVFIPVYCYTNCDTVELFLNGKSAGVQGYSFPRPGMQERWGVVPPRARVLRTTADLHLMWTLPYEPGTLKAVGTRDGQVVATTEVATAGEAAAIDLQADRRSIRADRRDVAHVTVRIVDAQARMAPTANQEVMFEIRGEGRSIGLDNGDMRSHEDYKGKTRRAYNGMCLAILQSTGKAGQIQVRATSPGLKPASLTIETVG
jgi:beta-galactosidase